MSRIAVIGSVNLDLVATVKKLPQPGETVTDAELSRFPGGKGANQALAAKRLGLRRGKRLGSSGLLPDRAARESTSPSAPSFTASRATCSCCAMTRRMLPSSPCSRSIWT